MRDDGTFPRFFAVPRAAERLPIDRPRPFDSGGSAFRRTFGRESESNGAARFHGAAVIVGQTNTGPGIAFAAAIESRTPYRRTVESRCLPSKCYRSGRARADQSDGCGACICILSAGSLYKLGGVYSFRSFCFSWVFVLSSVLQIVSSMQTVSAQVLGRPVTRSPPSPEGL